MMSLVCTLQYRHNKGDGVSNYRRLECLLNRLIRRRSQKTSKLRVTGLCGSDPPVTGGFPSQRASNAENTSVLWRLHASVNTVMTRVCSRKNAGPALEGQPKTPCIIGNDKRCRSIFREQANNVSHETVEQGMLTIIVQFYWPLYCVMNLNRLNSCGYEYEHLSVE